ncbi:MAG: carboxypeptidase-like regulatory domain-containing protein [Acidobacteriota bacterium]
MNQQKTLLFLILALAVTVGLSAQSVNSSVGGRVTDQTGAVLPEAEVQLINLDTGGQKETVTNETGRYLFPSVPVGQYTLQVVMPGFKSFERVNFEVVVSQRMAIDVVMQVGEIADSVTVEAGGLTQVLETTSNELGTLIDSKRVQELPLNGRNFLQLGLLSGATQPTRGIEDLVSNQGDILAAASVWPACVRTFPLTRSMVCTWAAAG